MSDDTWLTAGMLWPDLARQAEEMERLLAPTCECGTTITLGKDDAPDFHSDFCPIYKKWKREYGTKKDGT